MSIYIDELENLTLYRKKFYAPINEENKRKGSVIFLLSNGLESSKKMMQHPLMLNNNLYESYYIEKDITYFINQENALIKKYEQFVHESVNMVRTDSVETKQIKESEVSSIVDSLDDQEYYYLAGSNDREVDNYVKAMKGSYIYRDVYKENGEPVGFIDLYKFDPLDTSARIVIAVKEQHRGKGIAKKLIQGALEFAHTSGLEEVYYTAHYTNEASNELAKVNGFKYDHDMKELKKNAYVMKLRNVMIESSNKIKFKTPQELLKWMSKNISYGYMKKDGSVYKGSLDNSNDKNDYYNEYILQSPQELEKNKYGVCWDQTEFERYHFNKMGVKNEIIYCIHDVKPNYPTHTFAIITLEDGLYWFENSWEKYRGIHGPYKTNKEIIDIVQKYSIKEDKKKAKWKAGKINKPEYGISCKEFMDFANKSVGHELLGENVNIVTEELTEYKSPYIPKSKQYTLNEHSLSTNYEDSNCVIFFNEMLDEQVFNESSNKNNQMLRRLLYDERLRSNKEAILMYDKIKEDMPWIKRTFIDYKFYNRYNLFVDWSYYTQSFFKNNIYKLDKGIDLYFEFVNRFLEDKRLDLNGYTKKTVFVNIMDWVDKNTDIDAWDYTKAINPLSIIYRLMKTSPSRLKDKWGQYNFVFLGDNAYFKVDFSSFEVKDLIRFITNIKNIIARNPVQDVVPLNQESPKAIVANIVQKIEDNKGIKINNLTGGTASLTPQDIQNKLDKGISSKGTDNTDAKKAELVNAIQKAAEKSNTTDEAIDTLDKDHDPNWLKDLMSDLENGEQNNVNLTKARASRMTELNNRFLDKKYEGMTIKDIIESSDKEDPLEVDSLPIESINEGWKEMSFKNFGKSYNINQDIFDMIVFFGSRSEPISVVDYTIEDTSTSEDFVETWTVKCEDAYGQRFTIKFDIPKLKDNRFMRLRGNEKTINAQLVLLPIIKTDEDTVQIVSNYNKIFVRRFGTNTGKSNVLSDRIIKTLDKYEGKDIIVTPGDNSVVCSKYELPIDYIDLASVYNKIEIRDKNSVYIFYFNMDELQEELKAMKYVHGNNNLLPVGIKYLGAGKKEPLTLQGWSMFSSMLYTYLCGYNNEIDRKEFISLYESTNPASKYTYSKASILNTEIPIIVIMGYNEGLQSALKKGHIQYTVSDKRIKYNKNYQDIVKFKDGYIYYDIDYNSSLLMNGLKECNTEDFSLKEMNSKAMWIEFLDIFGGRIKADGLDNFYDCMVDPNMAKVCKKYELPTDYIEILAYANMLLSDNKYNKHTDIGGNRMRSNEIIAGYTYKVLADAYGDYKNQLKRNKKGATMSMKQSAVIDNILLDPTASDLSILNPLLELESANSVSFKGLSGMNSDRSYSLDKRTYDESMLGVLGMSTGFAANVGITRQATLDASIDTKRGYIKNNKEDFGVTKTLCATEAMTPLGTTRDDPFRSAMTFIQTAKHTMRVKKGMPNLVTNGADEALPYLTSDVFAFKAKQNGKVVEINDNYMIVEYTGFKSKNGAQTTSDIKQYDYIDLRENVKKNSDGGFFITVKLDPTIKKGDTFKQNDIIAYDKLSYSDAIGSKSTNDTKLSYNIGTLTKVAIMNTDEGFEDSAIISEYLSDAMTSEVVVKKEYVFPKNTNIYNMVKKGQEIEEGEPLIIFQNAFDEKDANLLIKAITDDEDTVNELGRISIKSKVTGIVQDIKIYRTVEKDELSDSLKKQVDLYEKDIRGLKSTMKKYNIKQENTLDPDYKLDATGKLKNAQDSVLIEFYLKYEDRMSIGDKLVYYSALKGVVKDIFPEGKEPYTDYRPTEKIHSLLALSSTTARMVSSVMIVGSINKVMVELDRRVKETMSMKTKDLEQM